MDDSFDDTEKAKLSFAELTIVDVGEAVGVAIDLVVDAVELQPNKKNIVVNIDNLDKFLFL